MPNINSLFFYYVPLPIRFASSTFFKKSCLPGNFDLPLFASPVLCRSKTPVEVHMTSARPDLSSLLTVLPLSYSARTLRSILMDSSAVATWQIWTVKAVAQGTTQRFHKFCPSNKRLHAIRQLLSPAFFAASSILMTSPRPLRGGDSQRDQPSVISFRTSGLMPPLARMVIVYSEMGSA